MPEGNPESAKSKIYGALQWRKVHIEDLKPAPYNPRSISKAARAASLKMLTGKIDINEHEADAMWLGLEAAKAIRTGQVLAGAK